MKDMRIVNIIIALAGLVAAIFYTASDNEAQGTVVLLVFVLYFVALPHIVRRV